MKRILLAIIAVILFVQCQYRHKQQHRRLIPLPITISEIVSTIKPSEGIMYGVREHQIKDITSFQIIGY